jgi:hypothetical protein
LLLTLGCVKSVSALAAFLVLALPAAASTPRILAPMDWWPVASPDGTHVAFTRVYPNHMELWTVDLGTRRIARIGTAAGQLFPTWLSSGELAYASGGVLWVADPSGTRKHRYHAPTGASAPAARPGSTQLAYVLRGDLRVDREVWAHAAIGHPAWSPSGTDLAFRRDDGIYVSTGPGVVHKIFGAANPGDPVWSHDGSRLAFAVGPTVWVAGKAVVPAYAAARDRPDVSSVAWSPDGRRLAFSWRGGVDEISLPTRAEHVASSAGVGVGYTSQGMLVFSGPRESCPGHFAIVVGDRVVSGTCLVTGTPQADVIEGTPRENDVIHAGAGNDRVHANDGHTDRVDCGPGLDVVWADRTDKLTGCETVHR